MRLSDLTGANSDQSAIDIRGLSADSREVEPGYLFAALSGVREDGARYIGDAISHGAVAVLGPPGLSFENQQRVYFLEDPNPRRRFALMAARFYGPQPETLVAVTGTNGKSSVACFVCQIWTALGREAGSIGTLGVTGPDFHEPSSLTTPDPVRLYRNLRRLRDRGVDHACIEASSHGLSQYRLDGMRIKAAGFTNLTRDHLDYHGSEKAYLAAKLRLFTDILGSGDVAVLNADSDAFAQVEAACKKAGRTVFSVGKAGRDIALAGREILDGGQRLRLHHAGRDYDITVPLIGDFQAANVLVAAGLVIAAGEKADAVMTALPRLQGVRGRMELVGRRENGAPVFVDYAHTPDALAHVLRALRPHAAGKLSVLFGCGGERDTGKRAMMGRIAADLADRVYVTDDNPRNEDAAAIRAEIMAACPGAAEVADRAEAIAQAVAALGPDDVLLLAGKGHEQGQIIGDETVPFDDAEIARSLLEKRTENDNG